MMLNYESKDFHFSLIPKITVSVFIFVCLFVCLFMVDSISLVERACTLNSYPCFISSEVGSGDT